jgi:hypothetical protein
LQPTLSELDALQLNPHREHDVRRKHRGAWPSSIPNCLYFYDTSTAEANIVGAITNMTDGPGGHPLTGYERVRRLQARTVRNH